MKKKLLALFLAAAMVGTAAGCAQDSNSSTNEQESTASQTDEGSEASNGEVLTLRMGSWADTAEHEPGLIGMEEAIGIKVEYQKYPTDADFWNNLPAQIAAKTAPDFIVLSNELFLPYILDGMIAPISKYVEDGTISCWDIVAQQAKDVWTIDGEIYAVPAYQAPAVFAVNMDLWNEAGLTEADFPETWNDVLDACKVFKDTLGMPGLYVNTQEYHLTQYCRTFGGGWGVGKTLDSPENAAALQFIIDAYRQGYVITPKELGVNYDGNVVMSGDAAMSTGGPWYVNDFGKNAPDIEMKYLKVPHAVGHEDSAGTYYSPGYAMVKGCAHEKETAMAINYMNNETHDRALMDIGYIPVDDKYFSEYSERHPDLAELLEAIPKSNGFDYPPAGKVFADGLISRMEEALFNPDSSLTGEQIVKELQEEYGT